jgi:hypothetical protein
MNYPDFHRGELPADNAVRPFVYLTLWTTAIIGTAIFVFKDLPLQRAERSYLRGEAFLTDDLKVCHYTKGEVLSLHAYRLCPKHLDIAE